MHVYLSICVLSHADDNIHASLCSFTFALHFAHASLSKLGSSCVTRGMNKRVLALYSDPYPIICALLALFLLPKGIRNTYFFEFALYLKIQF